MNFSVVAILLISSKKDWTIFEGKLDFENVTLTALFAITAAQGVY